MNGKKKFIKAFKIGRCRRCCMSKEKVGHKYIDGKWPLVRTAHEPSVIIWANLAVGPLSRFFRSCFTGFISLIIMAVSLTGIVIAKYY